MLTTIELGNFLSHSDTKLEFGKGVTVFVGHNGSGKSSIIDAITFALFGQHTRSSNKSLVRRGSSEGFSKVAFSILGREFEAIRKIDSKGTLSAQLFEKKLGNLVPLVAGERKQFGESMTKEIESIIGMDFDKLKIASIVQQGELNSIIDADPKQFKELINAVIGIDKLDFAFGLMKDVIENFRMSIRKELEYDDTDIDILTKKLDVVTKEIEELEPQKEKFLAQKHEQEHKLNLLQKKIDSNSIKENKIRDLETRKLELVRYVKTAISSLQKEIQEKERKLLDCQECFEIVLSKNDLEHHIKQLEASLEDCRHEIRKCSENVGSLSGQEDIAGKLHLKNGKCPVCDSQVDKLNPIFQIEHIRDEITKLREKIADLMKSEKMMLLEKNKHEQNLQKAMKAETTLRVHAIQNRNELSLLKNEISTLKNNIQNIPSNFDSSCNIVDLVIDSHSQTLAQTISILQEETRGFDVLEFNNVKSEFDQMRKLQSITDQQFGAVSQKIDSDKIQKQKASAILNELVYVKEYVFELEKIRSQIFNRDGPVATSLRSWALNIISQKASEYLFSFNTKIQRIFLEEKARNVSISCYSGNTVLELESLSGGEKVSIALALRLGMAHILGLSNLNFIILDEPTTHLDEERKKSLVGVLSNIFESNLGTITQFIIITHDSEIFENSSVDTIYNFEAAPEGTRITSL